MTPVTTLQHFEDESKMKPGDCLTPDNNLPPWVHLEKFQRAQKFYMSNICTLIFGFHLSLLLGLRLPVLFEVLLLTHRSDTPEKAIQRYLATFAHISQWNDDSINEKQSLSRTSLRKVRRMHRSIMRKWGHTTSKKFCQTVPSTAQETDNPLPIISQYDMAITLTSFFVAPLLFSRACGLKCSVTDIEDYLHFWRVVGYMLGIDDSYNVASGSFSETQIFCRHLYDDIMTTVEKSSSPRYNQLADAYCFGINKHLLFGLPVLSTNSAVAYFYGYYGRHRCFSLSVADWLRFYFLHILGFLLFWCPSFRLMLNKVLYQLYQNTQQKHTLY